MSFKAGDRIEVTTNTLGVAPRHGEVLESTSVGAIRVRWDDGHESVFMPGSNCQVLPPIRRRGAPSRSARNAPSK